MILKILLDEKSLSELEIVQKLGMESKKIKSNLKQLQKEGMIKKKDEKFTLP
jgi:predicted transcriptional regulator